MKYEVIVQKDLPQKILISLLAPGANCWNFINESLFFLLQPVIPLPPLVEVTSGEENEEVLYSHRAKLFRYADREWKERGLGDMKILKNRANGFCRLLMRREQVLKICLNHYLTPDISFKPYSAIDQKTWMWAAKDYSDEDGPKEEKFALR